MEFKPRDYQKTAIDFTLTNCKSALFLGLGLGKTVITLTVLEELINSFEVKAPLIVAPKRVAENTWGDEIRKWAHTKDLKLSVIAGDRKARERAAVAPADIYVIGRDNIHWLVTWMLQVKKKLLYDMLVLDELSSFKNPSSKRFKAAKKIAGKMQRVIGLTGTPAPNGIGDLWSQIYLLDQGERLGHTVTEFRRNYMSRKFNGFGWEPRPGAEVIVKDKIADICLSMKSEDHLDIPERIDIVDRVSLESMAKYKQFVTKKVLELGGVDITPMNAGTLYMKLLQYANGAVYTSEEDRLQNPDLPKWIEVDNSKLDALEEEIEMLLGEPVLVLYQFKSDLERIQARVKGARVLDTPQDLKDWNAGKISVALCQPQSVAMGLNLQTGGHHMIHYGLGWDLETYQQVVGRLHRSGQTKAVVNKMLIGRNTVEELVLGRLMDKAGVQNDLLEALKKAVYL
jgi:SNF2 family DNA or RNA helicase